MEVLPVVFTWFVILSNHHILGFSQKASTTDFPYSFMTADAEAVGAKTYDYIIVGGGTAGCPLAATLSANYSVLVVERGGSPYGIPTIDNESGLLAVRAESDYSQTFVSEDGVPGARGRVLGGSTAKEIFREINNQIQPSRHNFLKEWLGIN